MATDRRAEVVWQGSLREGSGTIVSTTSGAIGEQPVTWVNRSEDAPTATSPEELIAAAHASCFSMALTPSRLYCWTGVGLLRFGKCSFSVLSSAWEAATDRISSAEMTSTRGTRIGTMEPRCGCTRRALASAHTSYPAVEQPLC